MEITIAYHQLAKTYRKYTYTPNNGRLVYNNHWSWLVVFEALNKTNFAVVKILQWAIRNGRVIIKRTFLEQKC